MSDIISVYKTLLEYLNDGVYFVDNGRRILFWNNAAEKITGFTKEEVIGSYCWNNLMSHIDENGNELCTLGCPLEKTTIDGQIRTERLYLRHKDGYRIPIQVKAIPTFDNRGEIDGAVEIFTDVSSYEKISDRIQVLKKLGIVDKNLELPDSIYMEKIINSAIASYNENNVSNYFVLFELENCYDDETKSQALKIVVRTILNNISEKDTIGFWKNDNFIGIFENADTSKIRDAINKLKNLIKKTDIKIGNNIFNFNVSTGVTTIKSNDSFESIISRLEYLLKICKDGGNDL